MRNEIEYPITDDEVVAYLKSIQNLIQGASELGYGDMRPLLLEYAINRIQSTGKAGKCYASDTLGSSNGSDQSS